MRARPYDNRDVGGKKFHAREKKFYRADAAKGYHGGRRVVGRSERRTAKLGPEV